MKKEREKKRRRRVILSLVVGFIVAVIALIAYFIPFRKLLPAYRIPERREGELRMHFLYVGQGDCTIIEFPEGDVLVIDAGDGSFSVENGLVRYLKGLRPRSVSMLLTHADIDHYGGFAGLLEVFQADRFYLPVISSEAQDYRSLLKKIEKTGLKTQVLTRYGVIESPSGAYLVCLSPYSQGETDENDSSTVLYLNYGGVSAVLGGDITEAREKRLVEEYAIDETLFDSGEHEVRLSGVDILKAAHHGSRYSSSEEWLRLLSPKTAIISCGIGNAYAHPTGEVIARLKAASPNVKVYRTDEFEHIIVSIYEGKYTVLTDWE